MGCLTSDMFCLQLNFYFEDDAVGHLFAVDALELRKCTTCRLETFVKNANICAVEPLRLGAFGVLCFFFSFLVMSDSLITSLLFVFLR